jgi:hypothetical protein
MAGSDIHKKMNGQLLQLLRRGVMLTPEGIFSAIAGACYIASVSLYLRYKRVARFTRLIAADAELEY